MINKFYEHISWYLPRKLVYYCAIRLIANATTWQFSRTIVPNLRALDAIKRWEVNTYWEKVWKIN